MGHQAFLRARRPEHKQQRREAILAAARELALESGVRNVSLGSVAVAVCLAKSNVVRYFGTREEIYLELTAEEWQDWGTAATKRLKDATDSDGVVAALAETLVARPLFCDLLGNVSTSLEHNVSVPAARAFKRTVLRVVDEVGAGVAEVYPELSGGEAAELVAAAAGLAGVLYPVSNPAPTLVELYAQDPDLVAACPPFLPTLTRFLSAVAAGLPTLR
jgi:AcrR family transcriptional regulator